MMAGTRRSITLWLSIVGFVLLVWLAWRWFDNLPWVADFSTQSPLQVFQMAMGKPPPKGISDLRVAGRHSFIKRWVWMRLQANDRAINVLVAEDGIIPVSEPDARREIRSTQYRGNNRWNKYDDVDRKPVGWHEVTHIAKPEVYELWAGQAGQGWLWRGTMIVDRQKGLVYIHSLGD